MARSEVYAQAVLGKHSHVVRYYSAWAEDGYMYIQTEYCNGGSLAEEISTHIKRGTSFTESELKEMLRQVSHGLKYIHAQLLVHMDVKPGQCLSAIVSCTLFEKIFFSKCDVRREVDFGSINRNQYVVCV